MQNFILEALKKHKEAYFSVAIGITDVWDCACCVCFCVAVSWCHFLAAPDELFAWLLQLRI